MRIGEVARRAGVRVSLIRYYEQIGLLGEPERVSGQRRFDESVLRRLAVIDVAQRAGLSLQEIRELVEHGNDPMNDRLRELAERRLPEIDALIERAQRVRTWLQDATRSTVSASTTAPCSTTGPPGCQRCAHVGHHKRRRPVTLRSIVLFVATLKPTPPARR